MLHITVRSAAPVRLLVPLPFILLASPLPAQRAPTPAVTVTVAGTVFDSVARQSVAGALVQLVSRTTAGLTYSVRSDSSGAFRLTGVAPGHYLAGFLSGALDALGMSAVERSLDVGTDSLVSLPLSVPSPATVREALCGAAGRSDSSGVLVGYVRDADDSLPLAGSRVVLLWSETVIDAAGLHADRRQIPAKSATSGWYGVCGVPTDIAVSARAELGPRASGYVELSVPPRGVLEFDFAIPAESAAVVLPDRAASLGAEPVRRGTARLVGMVRREDGVPLGGAVVVVRGSPSRGTSGVDGRFALDALPAGTQTVEVRSIGYAPTRVAVNLASGRTAEATVVMGERVDVLDRVRVYGKGRRGDITGFLDRRQRGFGQFLGAQDIERRQPVYFSDLFRTMTGVRVIPIAPFGYRLVLTRGALSCQPAIFVDNLQLTDVDNVDDVSSASDVVAVEVYQDVETPPQYRVGTCGSIIIWTGPRAP